jgi:hypothetical protein
MKEDKFMIDQLTRLDEKTDDIKNLAIDIYKELSKRPTLTIWMSIIGTIMIIIVGSYTYTATMASDFKGVTSEVKGDTKQIKGHLIMNEERLAELHDRINTVDRKFIYFRDKLERNGK